MGFKRKFECKEGLYGGIKEQIEAYKGRWISCLFFPLLFWANNTMLKKWKMGIANWQNNGKCVACILSFPSMPPVLFYSFTFHLHLIFFILSNSPFLTGINWAAERLRLSFLTCILVMGWFSDFILRHSAEPSDTVQLRVTKPWVYSNARDLKP